MGSWTLAVLDYYYQFHQLNQTMQLLVDLGLIINLDKCHLVPSQIITYLGAVFNLDTFCEVETWEFVGMHLADLRWTPSPPHGGLK
jgi:hypothetical protein